MTLSVLRPVAFHDDLTPDSIGKVLAMSFSIDLPGNKKLQMVAASDIGAIGAQAFLAHELYTDQALTIVGESLTYPDFKSIFEEILGSPLPTLPHLGPGDVQVVRCCGL